MDKKLHQINQKITVFTTKKRKHSDTSPPGPAKDSKRSNIPNRGKLTKSLKMGDSEPDDKTPTHLSQLIDPIMKEFKSFKEAMTCQKSEISEEICRRKKVITSQKSEITNEINVKVDTNSMSILKVLDENQELRREIKELKDRVTKMETTQLSNNIIVTGIPEQPFETYEKTKQRVHDVVAEAIKSSDPANEANALSLATSIDITYCSRIGKHRLGYNRPISVSLSHKEDKDKIFSIKSKLPHSICINNEYPIHVK